MKTKNGERGIKALEPSGSKYNSEFYAVCMHTHTHTLTYTPHTSEPQKLDQHTWTQEGKWLQPE